MISIVLPTFNEVDNFKKIVREILTVFRDNNIDGNIIIVDDNSPDGTGIMAQRLSENLPKQLYVIDREAKMGLGSAYIAGFKKALFLGADYIFEMDADFSHNPHSIPSFLKAMQDSDLVIGSRYIDGGSTKNWELYRKLISRFGTLYAKTILRLEINDLTSGFRCYKRQVLEKINLDQIQSDGYSFQIEMAFKTKLAGFKIKEIPIVFADRKNGISKFSKKIFYEAFWIVWKLKLNSKQQIIPKK